MSESNTAVRRPLPLWPYSASDNVNRARTSEPDKMAFNLSMAFVDYPWRFVSVPSRELEPGGVLLTRMDLTQNSRLGRRG